ncbi:hypothetical protein [Hymenobacter psoromatis]|uniref:hypothetical protein n=1 Tax=Hymenobacter psoromatis TaxID=1484116 RepID=UPI001CBDB19F|nr:hypothetical protein [Hymenobacter psoromatis]
MLGSRAPRVNLSATGGFTFKNDNLLTDRSQVEPSSRASVRYISAPTAPKSLVAAAALENRQ